MSESERKDAIEEAESQQGQIYKGVDTAYLPRDSALARKLTNGTSITKSMIPVTFVPFANWAKRYFGNALSIPETRATNSDARSLALMKDEWHSLHTSQFIWTKSILPNLILTCMGDRMEMSHSVEGRPVFLDHRLTEFVNHLPPSMKIKYTPAVEQSKASFYSVDSGYGDETEPSSPVDASPIVQEKWILREATKKYITHEMYSRKKYPFTAPYMFPVGGPLHKLMLRLVTHKNVAHLGFVDVDRAVALLDKAFVSQSKAGDGFALRMLFVIAQWVVLSQALDIETAISGNGPGDDGGDWQCDEMSKNGTEWAWC
jgi:asparagine synthase (glutamine-hydrolysing)